MSILSDLPELASGPSVTTAAGLVAVGAVASAVRRQPLAEVCVAWALGFLVLHLLAGLLGGSVATGFALACALVAVLVVAAPWLLGVLPAASPADRSRHSNARPERPEAEPTVASPGIRAQQRAVRSREAEAHAVVADRLARPEPSTHLWSADGYRDVTPGSAP